MGKEKRAYVFVLAAAALWGCIGLFFKMVSSVGLTSMQAVAARVLVAAVFYTAFLLIKDKDALKIKLKHIPYFIGTGIVSLAFFNFCYFNAIEESSMAVAAILLYTAPIIVSLLSAVLFKEKITKIKIAALILTFIGCMLVTGIFESGGRVSAKAILFGLGSGLGYALYTIFGKYALRKYKAETVTAYTFIVSAIGVVPLSGLHTRLPELMTVQGSVGSLCLGIFCCILPYILYTKGLESIEAGRASIIATLEPVVAAIIGTVVFREEMTLVKALGIIVVVFAIAMINFKTKKAAR